MASAKVPQLSKDMIKKLSIIQKKYSLKPKVQSLQLPGSAGKYASQLFLGAHSRNILDEVQKDASSILNLANKSSRVRDFFNQPTFTKEEKKKQIKTLDKLLTQLKISFPVYRFVAVLLALRKSTKLIPILKNFQEILKDYRGIREGKITTATPLTPDRLKEISEGIKKVFLKPKETMTLKNIVDPKIKGGSILFFSLGGPELKYYDLSLRTIQKNRNDLINRKFKQLLAKRLQQFLEKNKQKRQELLQESEKKRKEEIGIFKAEQQRQLQNYLDEVQARREREDAEDALNPPVWPDIIKKLEDSYKRLVAEGKIKPTDSASKPKSSHH